MKLLPKGDNSYGSHGPTDNNALNAALKSVWGQYRTWPTTWLRSKQDYGIGQRNNLWMRFHALDEARDGKFGDPNFTLIALWDGASGDGPGGTSDLVDKVRTMGGRNKNN